jgi:hypothetical protein
MSGRKKHLTLRPMPSALTPNGVEATLVMSMWSLRKYNFEEMLLVGNASQAARR